MMKSLAFVLAFLSCSLAWAQDDATQSAIYWAGTLSCSGTSGCVKTSTGSSDCALFAAGTQPGNELRSYATIVQGSDDAFTACWTLATSGFSIVPATLTITDPGYSGPGACEVIEGIASDVELPRLDSRPWYAGLKTLNGTRRSASADGICSTAIWSAGDYLYPPCDVDADCSGLSAGTCDTTPDSDQLRRVGAFLFCETNAGGTETMIVQKRIRLPMR